MKLISTLLVLTSTMAFSLPTFAEVTSPQKIVGKGKASAYPSAWARKKARERAQADRAQKVRDYQLACEAEGKTFSIDDWKFTTSRRATKNLYRAKSVTLVYCQ